MAKIDNEVACTRCTECGQEAGEPEAMCEGCKDVLLCERCGGRVAQAGDNLCPGCEEQDDEARREASQDEEV